MIREQANRIGRMIATARRNKGWSLRQLSNETGISHTWLLKLERGEYLTPAPDLLIRVADALNIDPERIERIVKGQMSDSLPGVRTYFRAKYDLNAEEIDQIERTVQDIQRSHEGGDST
jgi:transcriptional regulator with XRE-family HTH domain